MSKNKFSRLLVSLFAVGLVLFSGNTAYAQTTPAPTFRTGDIVTVMNNTTTSGESNEVNAAPGNVLEYRMIVQNTRPGSVATDILVGVLWPQTPSKKLTLTMEAKANGVTVSDTAIVNVINANENHWLDYYKGHTRVFSPRCPKGCAIDDKYFLNGEPINIGELYYGESAQIMFKAAVNQMPSTSPSPTPTPSPSPSVTPSPSATASPTATPAVIGQSTGPSQLPKTGLPLAGLALSGLLPMGAGLRRFTRKSADLKSANSLWGERELKK